MASMEELVVMGLLGLVSVLISAYLLFRTCRFAERRGRGKGSVVIPVIISYTIVLVANALLNPGDNLLIDAFRRNVAVFFGVTGIVALGLGCTAVAEEILNKLGRKSLSIAVFRGAKVFVNGRLAWTATGIVFIQNVLPPFVHSGILADELTRSLATGLLTYTPHLVSVLLLYYWVRCIMDAYAFSGRPKEAAGTRKTEEARAGEARKASKTGEDGKVEEKEAKEARTEEARRGKEDSEKATRLRKHVPEEQ